MNGLCIFGEFGSSSFARSGSLVKATVGGKFATSFGHDGLGNLTKKPGVTFWTHESNGPRGRKRLTAATVDGEARGRRWFA